MSAMTVPLKIRPAVKSEGISRSISLQITYVELMETVSTYRGYYEGIIYY